MPQTVEQALRQAQLYTDDRLYRLIHLPPNAIMVAASILAQIGEPFAALIADKDEVTLIMPDDLAAEFATRLRDHRASESAYQLITFDLELEPTLTGFMAQVAAALAAAEVPIMPLAAFNRDHILVPADRFEIAWNTLKGLQS
jgi:hypothetical protein